MSNQSFVARERLLMCHRQGRRRTSGDGPL
jgi:hypothetical protein